MNHEEVIVRGCLSGWSWLNSQPEKFQNSIKIWSPYCWKLLVQFDLTLSIFLILNGFNYSTGNIPLHPPSLQPLFSSFMWLSLDKEQTHCSNKNVSCLPYTKETRDYILPFPCYMKEGCRICYFIIFLNSCKGETSF